MTIQSDRIALLTSVLCLATLPVWAESKVSYSDGVSLFQVIDQSPADSNPQLREIKTTFALAPVGATWQAAGTIEATSLPTGEATLLLTDLLIENIAGPTQAAVLEVEHQFDNETTTPVSYEAHLDGNFLHTEVGDNLIREARLDYVAQVNTESIGAFQGAAGMVAGPVPFAALLGPHELLFPPARSQRHTLNFYLDSIGDAIALENSAEIRVAASSVPALSRGAATALGVLLLATGLGCFARLQRSRI
jgi:hypothetical protein